MKHPHIDIDPTHNFTMGVCFENIVAKECGQKVQDLVSHHVGRGMQKSP